ncbi:MAG: nucleotidyltransferase substrate binding protein [Thermoguttaceae bacterium]|nr:nucleotidyltransferase substrate binding protein [Thermoguttaceae bacterium]
MQNRAVERVGGSPGNTVRLAYKEGFIDDVDVWLEMLKRRNEAAHIYDLERVEDALDLIYSDFIPVFQKLASTLKEMVKEDSGE